MGPYESVSISCLHPPPRVSEAGWEVTVKTSDVDDADTRAQVYVTVYGKTDVSDRLPLGTTGDFDRDHESKHKVRYMYMSYEDPKIYTSEEPEVRGI